MAFEIREATVAIASLELDKLVEFYQRLLGQEPTTWIANTYAEFKLAGLQMRFFNPRTSHQSEFKGRGGAISLCWEVENLEAAIAQLTALEHAPKGTIVSAEYGREIYAYDPEGNRLILYQKH